jgi:hypothetical protein
MQDKELRFAFVEMLFALAIAEVAIASSHIVSIERSLVLKAPAIAHLLLATLLIATSWLGWSVSRSRNKKSELDSPFSMDFIGLLLDVLLVVIYFILVRQAEISDKEPYDLMPASAVPESHWLIWIFTIYVIWDLVSKVLQEPVFYVKPRKWRSRDAITLILCSAACSAICTCLVCIVYWRARDIARDSDVVILDGALACVVLLFRAIKSVVEGWLHSQIPSLVKFKAFEVKRLSKHREARWTGVLLLAYAALVALTWR